MKTFKKVVGPYMYGEKDGRVVSTNDSRPYLPFGGRAAFVIVLGLLASVSLLRHNLLSLSPISASSGTTVPSPYGPASTQLNWITCGDRFQCANLSVPLDYLNKTDQRKVSIAITRYLASKQDSKTGTIIINPGGPGGSGTRATYGLGPTLDKVFQGSFDVLGFDPRGIGLTLPSVTCLESLITRYSLGQILGSTAPSLNLHDIGIWDSFAQVIAEECEANSGADVLPYVNTPSVARDIAAIVDALHAEKKHHVSYWGFSYGTNLGAIFTGMFPNKLHKIVLDGIRSPFDAREIYDWGYTSLASQNDMVEGYFEICEKVGKSRCPLAGSEKGVKKTVMDLLSSLYDRPLPVSSDKIAGLVTFYNYKSFFYGTLYRPYGWRRFADITAELLNGNGTSFVSATDIGPSGLAGAESGVAVLCTDAVQATNYTLSSWSEFVHNMTQLSFIAGDSRSLDTLPCRHWYSTPNERWLGTFDDVHLKVPVLMIGNTYDPATPLASAKRLLARMGQNAVLLEQRSYGHCSVSSASTCTFKAILDYLLDGSLPEQDKVCEVDDKDYENYFPKNQKLASHDQFRQTLEAIANYIP